jgi:hypothetical protein
MGRDQHAERFFSEAYDDVLDTRRRAEFDAHLAACPACAGAFACYRASIDLVRAMPQARMPVEVRLPATAPAGARRAWLPVPGIPWRSLRQPRALGGLALAAVVVLVTTVAVTHPSSGPATTAFAPGPSTLSSGADRVPVPANPPAAAQPAGPGAAVQGGLSAVPLACTTTSVPASGSVPAEFSSRATTTTPERPGEELVIATDADHYAPGQQVLVYARLLSPGVALSTAGTVNAPRHPLAVQPCVGIPLAAGSGSGNMAAAVPAPVPGPPGGPDGQRAVASPTLSADEVPLEVVTIPGGAIPGTVVTLSADVPAGSPLRGEPPMHATLTVRVSAR